MMMQTNIGELLIDLGHFIKEKEAEAIKAGQERDYYAQRLQEAESERQLYINRAEKAEFVLKEAKADVDRMQWMEENHQSKTFTTVVDVVTSLTCTLRDAVDHKIFAE